MAESDLSIIIRAKNEASAVLKQVEGSVGGLGKTMGTALKFGGIAAAGGIGVAALALKGFVEDAMESQKIMAQTNAVLKSTQGVSGMTAKSVTDLADKLSRVIPVDDELIQSTENMLLTFTKIGSDIFPQVTETALDMATALGGDPVDAAMKLGKALNDPIAGVTALRKVGVALTDQQKDQIKGFMDVNDIASAQGVILKELSVEFGNSGRAAGETTAGKFKILQTQIGNVKEAIGTALLPTLTKLGDKLTGVLADHQDDIQKFADMLAIKVPDAIDAIGAAIEKAMPTIKELGDGIASGLNVIKPALEWVMDNQIAVAAAFAAIGVAALIAFTPVTGPVAAIVGGLGVLLFTVGKVREAWDDFTVANDRAAASADKSGEPLTNEQKTLAALQYVAETTGIGLVQMAKLSGQALYELGHIEFVVLSAAFDGISNQISILKGHIVDDWVPAIGAAWRGLKYEVDWIPGFFAGFVPVFEGVVNSIQWMIDRVYNLKDAFYSVRDAVASFVNKLKDIPGVGLVGDLLDFAHVPGRASGGPASGWTLVGERGPELVNFPGGSHVFSNDDSRHMAAGNTYHVYIQTYQQVGDPQSGLAALGGLA